VEANGYRDGDGTPMLTGQLPAIAPVSGVSDAYDYEARVAINNLMQFMKNVHLMAP